MSWSQPTFEAVANLVGARTGLAFSACRRDGVEQGIRRAMARAGIPDPESYRARLAADPVVLDDLIVELTVGETYFFREPGQHEAIRRDIVPEVLGRRGPDHVLRVWSAGCASGEEAYSLAILFEREGLAGRAHLLATDISRAALARARQAVFSSWSLRGEGADAAKPYLEKHRDRFRLVERLRRRVDFDYLNLALDAYPSFATGTWGMDLILCRNVLIYFDPETVAAVARRLFDTLADGGWLITASSDPPLGNLAPFQSVVLPEGVFYRRPALNWSPSSEMPWQQSPAQGTVPISEENEPVTGTRLLGGPEPLYPPWAPLQDVTDAAPQATNSRDTEVLRDSARESFVRGDYATVVRLTRDLAADAGAACLHVRALANLHMADAERACAAAVARHRLAPELNYLHGLLLLNLDRVEEATRAVRRVIYLDRTLAIAHFTLGALLRRGGDLAGARRAYRNAGLLCSACPADQTVPLADGERAGRLAEAAAAELALLDAESEVAT